MIVSFFVPHQWVSVPSNFLQQCAIILVGFGYVLGGANSLRVNLEAVSRRAPDWPYKLLLVVALLVTVVVGVVDGIPREGGFTNPGTTSKWIYDYLFSPMSSTMFALLAFYMAS